jgi:hypothetical protein
MKKTINDLKFLSNSLNIKKIPKTKTSICNIILNSPKYNMLNKEQISEMCNNDKIKYYKLLEKRLYNKTISKYNNNYIKPCLCFTGSKNNEYGSIKVFGKKYRVHRISYVLFNNIFIEDLPIYLDICHGKGCDVTCIEPTHLELKTKSENNYDDKIRDGTIQRGEKHYLSKITENIAYKIKISKGNGKTQKQRAEEFGVKIHIIKDIDSNKTWAHLPNKNGEIINNNEKRTKYRNKYKDKKDFIITDKQYKEIFIKIKNNIKLSETINQNVDSQCWIFQGCIKSGYGEISLNGLKYKTHILMYEAIHGIRNFVENKKEIRHLCNNRSCCNPDHLEFGTKSENMIDAIKNGSNVAKLNEQKIKEIRLLLKNGSTQKEMSEKYQVSIATISRIQNKKIWYFVKDEV